MLLRSPLPHHSALSSPTVPEPPQRSRAPMEEPFIVTGKIIGTMIRNGELVPEAGMECPNCKHRIDNSDVSSQWSGLPIGVKFDSTDLELLGHLEGKIGRAVSHVLIDDFIPTIEMAEGICYTHPENLPGVKLDGIASHFFHKICNAYDVGTRKRRKIRSNDYKVCDKNLRWHKTGKSRHILDNNGDIKGWKKIMVLRKGGAKAEKTNWTMHQYHLGVDENEMYVCCTSGGASWGPTWAVAPPAQEKFT
ncbi:hypothetical protein CFC21_024171 [Triticum aestivum]|uniref:NAC domain-containing protein n=2 Tax=Triticum aestivum TaxID=4565 RepID=A0A3B6C8I7_WHEAT|nr:SUPPRESSOR OF GAMMA RESPONSE 1-like [Triticum aestivum]KAF7009663.1 hypothetical protein CFC21_024171 [Triticum aestivum]